MFYHIFSLYEPLRSRPLLPEAERLIKVSLVGIESDIFLLVEKFMEQLAVGREGP